MLSLPDSLRGQLLDLLPGSDFSAPSLPGAGLTCHEGGRLNWMFLLATQGPLWDAQQDGAGQWPSFASLPTSPSPSLDLPPALPRGPEASQGHFEQISARP